MVGVMTSARPRRRCMLGGPHLALAAAVPLWFAVIGCEMPRDPEGTWQRSQAEAFRVGLSSHPPWTDLHDGRPTGIEVQLVRRFAQRIGADVRWRPGAESELVTLLDRGELDLVIGGIKHTTPWSSHAGLTRPYADWLDEKPVWLVRQGENRWLLEIDKFLQASRPEIRRLLEGVNRP